MGHLQTGEFVDMWVRDNLGKMVFKYMDGKPELLKEKTVYEAGWYEKPEETRPGPGQVRMRHPEIEEDIIVLAEAARHHKRAAWQLVQDQEFLGDEEPPS